MEAPHWMHLDIAGVSGVVDGSDIPYLAKGLGSFHSASLGAFTFSLRSLILGLIDSKFSWV